MRPSLPTCLLLLGGSVALALASSGCGSFYGCDATATCDPEEVEDLCPEDPAEGEVRSSCGVWVSASSGDDNHPGTPERPVKTLARGIELAHEGPGRVYACGEVYAEAVKLPDGIGLFGGFDCQDLRAWQYIGGEQKRAEIQAPVAVGALLLPESARESWIGDVKVVAPGAEEPGGSSIAVLALPGSRARLRRTEVVAGHGADGANGADGSADGQPAPKGVTGHDGSDACTLDVGAGGVAVTTACDGTDSSSGEGGDANGVAANDGLAGAPAPDFDSSEYGAGGHGEDLEKGSACTSGNGGAHGRDGDNGLGGKSDGQLTVQGYFGAAGGDGQAGVPGQGGGGGGASLGVCGAGPKGGAGGGSGGSGGCGGTGGKGGQAGGSSIGFALLSGEIYTEDVRITTGNGGRGGNGGFGQAGGQGGLPGYGGLSAPGGAQGGCAGGVGGLGGYGGWGGGGHGGHSIGFATVPGANLQQGEAISFLGKAGPGGLGGFPGTSAGDGYAGKATPSLVLDP